eukprot:Sdes_comp20818_c0_seq1m17265
MDFPGRPSGEDAVRETNIDSFSCKLSAVQLGYWRDEFLKEFAKGKPQRRSPIMNRGYYIRVAAIRKCLESFIEKNRSSPFQILNLGCGFDTTFWNLHQEKFILVC